MRNMKNEKNIINSDTNVKVSVIIPVHNSEKYISQCIDSVIGQNINETEIICVDDNSNDESYNILKKYAELDPRIKVLKNDTCLCAGICRNIGLEASTGEYVLFLDSDDWLVNSSLIKLYMTAKKFDSDVIRCKAIDFDDKTGCFNFSAHNALKKVPFFLFNKPLDYFKYYMFFSKICVAPWGGLFKRDFLIKEGIRFNSLKCVNDRSFYWSSIVKAKKIVFSNECLINYRTNLGTSLIGSRIKNFDCHFRSYELVYKASSAVPPKMRRNILNAEMFDMAHWLEKSAGTEYYDDIVEMMSEFLHDMDKTIWNNIKRCGWYGRMVRLIPDIEEFK